MVKQWNVVKLVRLLEAKIYVAGWCWDVKPKRHEAQRACATENQRVEVELYRFFFIFGWPVWRMLHRGPIMNMVGRALGGKVGPLALIRREKRSEFFSPDQIPNHLVNFVKWNELKWIEMNEISPKLCATLPWKTGVEKKIPWPGIGARWWRSSKATDSKERKVWLWSLLDDSRCKIFMYLQRKSKDELFLYNSDHLLYSTVFETFTNTDSWIW